MTDTLISLETAELAKEKGFDWPTAKAYDKCDMLCTPDRLINYNTGGFIKSAPTQSLLAKWLRDQHKIHIEITVGCDLGEHWFDFHIFKYPDSDHCSYGSSEEGIPTYEEALEEGLFQALKLIK